MRAFPLPLVAIALAALPTASAGAKTDAGGSCRSQAEVTAGAVTSLGIGPGSTDASVKHLRRAKGTLYQVPAAGQSAEVVFQHVTYALKPGTQFALACFGEAKGDPAKFPRLIVGHGDLTLRAADGQPGAVSNNAGMAGPSARVGMTIHVTVAGFEELHVQKSAKTPGDIQVTPYAGPQKGHCRYVHEATLDAGKDTAKYD